MRVEACAFLLHLFIMRFLFPTLLRFLPKAFALALIGGSAAADERSFEQVFQNAADDHPHFAVGAAYAKGQVAPTVFAAGPLEKGASQTVGQDARWHIGSISKSFTATLVMQLVDRGALDLERPVAEYLPAFRDHMHADWQRVTLRELLSHTARIPANAPSGLWSKTYDDPAFEGRRRALSGMWSTRLKGKSGTFTYSNIGYVLAGLIVEEVTGETWENLILSEIAKPLGLTSLGFGPPQGASDPKGHSSRFGFTRALDPANVMADNPKWVGPAGTLHMSLADLTRWGQAHLQACKGARPAFLSQASCQLMQTPEADDYGLGWVVEADPKAVWHNGSNTLWYAILLLSPEQDTVVAVATNVMAMGRLDTVLEDLNQSLAR